MEILVLFFIGIIQGITEFLPVSSSGHIVLFSKIFGIEESLLLSVILHVATLIAVVVVFWKDVWQMVKNPFSQKTMQIFIATIPTCLIALLLLPIIKSSFGGSFLPFCFLISAFVLFFSEKRTNKIEYGKIDYLSAFWIGVAQGFAVFPGISRSGSTISAGLWQKKDKSETAKFSFLMSIPIILASLFLETFECVKNGVRIENPIGIIIAFFAAFISGIFSIRVVMKLTKKASLKCFSVYLFMISVVSIFVL